MIDFKLIPLYSLVIILIGAVAYLIFRKPPTGDIDKPKITVVLNYDSLWHSPTNQIISGPVTVKPGIVNVPPSVIQIMNSTDTTSLKLVLKELLNNFYTIRTQETTTEDDSLKIVTVDTITQNKLVGQSLKYKIKFPITSTTTIINPPNSVKLYAGASISAGQNGLYDVSPQLSLALKKGTLIEIGYNTYALATGQDKYAFRFSLSQKIRLKK